MRDADTLTSVAVWLLQPYYFCPGGGKEKQKHQEIMTLGLINMLAECEILSSKTRCCYSFPATHGTVKLFVTAPCYKACLCCSARSTHTTESSIHTSHCARYFEICRCTNSCLRAWTNLLFTDQLRMQQLYTTQHVYSSGHHLYAVFFSANYTD